MDNFLLVMTNVPDESIAQAIIQAVLEKKLAACVNVLPAVRSFYSWNGTPQLATEIALLIKTTEAKYIALQALIQSIHPYDVPEIIGIPIAQGLPAYLQWVLQETGSA
ncbi:divalent-cation tolerance protein CutA [Undibacterium sp. Jales W-56]|uniref:divalent-cation tolerance protein CutA n=1 Tax=Undibacterium sp. Jales W-56 TaxID=2897325 RepID=UPI0021D2B581|nr:divalent-cation tolerance protein CutA [Undibacterium sp. Jales W-56]MCU6432184.1 divalent-cation tolerance protein CutA [Undibacterium sp. Jales W-56]